MTQYMCDIDLVSMCIKRIVSNFARLYETNLIKKGDRGQTCEKRVEA